MIRHIAIFLFLNLFLSNCNNSEKRNAYKSSQQPKIKCSANGCQGAYKGPEFINGSDIAHQFSNKMSKAVGDELKKLYLSKDYRKVDFSNIKMTTEGMGSGHVIYNLDIPFMAVNDKCDAYTSFDHVGGWDHIPALAERKMQLDHVLLDGQELDISNLKITPEGLQEYWIQWKHKITQIDCK